MRAKSRGGLTQKLGFIPRDFSTQKDSVWFHAVSVGEFNAILPLLKEFHKTFPEMGIVLSTTTATGQQLAKDKVGDFASVVYMPFDAPWALNSWLNKVKPKAMIIAETEIWPGLTAACKRRDIPLLVVNGRISPRSFKTYFNLRFLFGKVLSQFTTIGVQSEAEKDRYAALIGQKLKPGQINVLGNLKFDGLTERSQSEISALKVKVGIASDFAVLIGGSTHDGEETAMLDAFAVLKGQHKNLKMILVPRHPERFEKVAALVESTGLKVARYSQNGSFTSGADVYLLDAIGHLTDFYALATVAFVGGTLAPIGGHNLLEPYVYRVPVVCGPHTEKAKDMVLELDARQALTTITNTAQLTAQIEVLLNDANLRRTIGDKGYALIEESKGATNRAIDVIASALEPNKQSIKVKA